MCICLCRKLQTGSDSCIPALFYFFDNGRIIRRIANHCHILIVLGSRAEHRRTADVDVFYGIFHGNIRFGNSLTEWIEVYTHHIYKFNAVVFQCLKMAFIIPAGKQSAMYLRMQCLYTSVTDFRKSCYITDVDNLHIAVTQKFHSTTCGNNLPAQRTELLCKFHDTGLVADADKCSHIFKI